MAIRKQLYIVDELFDNELTIYPNSKGGVTIEIFDADTNMVVRCTQQELLELSREMARIYEEIREDNEKNKSDFV